MIPLVKVNMPSKEKTMGTLENVLYSGQISEGDIVYEFERKFSEYVMAENCLSVSSGTAALHMSLILSGISHGDEVITTPMTAEPTNLAILQAGGKVVWGDIDPVSGNLDPESVVKKISKKTKAIVVVHYAGYPARLDELRKIADIHGLFLIEDCAHALGALYKNKHVGLHGDFSIFSFQAIKHITTIDGGMLLIKDDKFVEAAKKLRWFGMLKGKDRKYVDITKLGYKYNSTNFSAALGILQLAEFEGKLEIVKNNGLFYDGEINKINSEISYAKTEECGVSSYWLYTLLSNKAEYIEMALIDNGIYASKLHRPNNRHSIFTESNSKLPGLELFYNKLLHIPCGWWVNEVSRNKIIEIVKKFAE